MSIRILDQAEVEKLPNKPKGYDIFGMTINGVYACERKVYHACGPLLRLSERTGKWVKAIPFDPNE